MEHVKFGHSGLMVSRLCLGTMTFGLQRNEAESHAILDAAAEGGVTFIDTADVYPLGGDLPLRGTTEEIIGSWMAGKRHSYVLATKCVGKMGPNEWNQGASRQHVLSAIDASLKRLRTDYVDLYQLHMYDANTPMDEALEALDTVVKSGKARYVGVSNWPAYKVALGIGRTELKQLAPIRSVQPRYNALFRTFERDLLPLCQEQGVAVISYTRWRAACSPASTSSRAGRRRAASPWAMRGRCIRPATGTSASSPPSRRCAASRPRRG